jgi:hypothetical protein
MKHNYGILSAMLLAFLFFSSCRSNMNPALADREVRELLRDVPGFDWELDQVSRLKDPKDTLYPTVPFDDPDSRKITERIQKNSAYRDGNKSIELVGQDWQKSLPLDENAGSTAQFGKCNAFGNATLFSVSTAKRRFVFIRFRCDL